MENYIVECRKLTKNFSGRYALREVDLCLEKGKIIGLLGPNGSGKTTLLKLINGLFVPTSGTLLVDGEVPGPVTKSYVSYLPDNNFLSGSMKVSQIFDMYADFFADFDKQKAQEMLRSLKLEENLRFKTMSKGMKEKVQLILIMSRNARLYCLDEPIGGVDPAAREYILRTIITNYAENATVLISTHLINEVEKVLDEAVMIKEGQILRQASVEAIREEYQMSLDDLFKEEFKC